MRRSTSFNALVTVVSACSAMACGLSRSQSLERDAHTENGFVANVAGEQMATTQAVISVNHYSSSTETSIAFSVGPRDSGLSLFMLAPADFFQTKSFRTDLRRGPTQQTRATLAVAGQAIEAGSIKVELKDGNLAGETYDTPQAINFLGRVSIICSVPFSEMHDNGSTQADAPRPSLDTGQEVLVADTGFTSERCGLLKEFATAPRQQL